ncbi:MAG: DedA family protein [Planctomycetota bacterium]|jgi:membrane protein DedA with SNARE-associated domain|nr:DedA family protein [Planctomycetota bacterium]
MELLQTVTDFVSSSPHFFVFLILFLCGLGLPVPEEVTLIAAAWMTLKGLANPWSMFGTALLAILVGDLATYTVGRTFGYRLVRLPYFKRVLSEDRLKKVDQFFDKYGDWAVFFARFVAGFRLGCYFIAGISRLKVHVFIFMDALAGVLSVGLTFIVIRRFGGEIEEAIQWVKRGHYALLVLALVAICAFVGWKYFRKKRAESMSVVEETAESPEKAG